MLTDFARDRTRAYTGLVSQREPPSAPIDASVLRQALSRQASGEDHDLGLIRERLTWTPEERLEANTAFLRFYVAARPPGPLLRED